MADGDFHEIDTLEFVSDLVEHQEQGRAAGLRNAARRTGAPS